MIVGQLRRVVQRGEAIFRQRLQLQAEEEQVVARLRDGLVDAVAPGAGLAVARVGGEGEVGEGGDAAGELLDRFKFAQRIRQAGGRSSQRLDRATVGGAEGGGTLFERGDVGRQARIVKA